MITPLRRVRLLTGPPSNREMALQGLRVLTASPVQPVKRALTRERTLQENPEYLLDEDGNMIIRGTSQDLETHESD